jgi:hypothetical protein
VVELALARRVSKATIDHHLAFAEPLVQDFPQLLQACLDGKVSPPAAKTIVEACEALDSEQRRAIDAELTALARTQTPGQLKKSVARKVTAIDLRDAQRRAKVARARPVVRATMHGDGTGTLRPTPRRTGRRLLGNPRPPSPRDPR